MGHPALVGYSILVLEDEPFIARCLEVILKAVGAEVHAAAGVAEATQLADRPKLSAAVLDCKHGIRSDHIIACRLTERGLPFVLYGAAEAGPYEAWPNAPVMGKFATRAEIIETLHAVLRSAPAKRRAVVSAALGANATPAAPPGAMADVEALIRRRTLANRPHRAPDRV